MYYLAPLVKYFAPNPRMLLMCMLLFGCCVLTVVSKCKAIFLDDYLKSCNNLCKKLFAHVAKNDKCNCYVVLEQGPTGDLFILLVKFLLYICSFIGATIYR